ncbi:MAG: nitrous oxide reductase accessory protein NosL [Bacteroidota bacterium]
MTRSARIRWVIVPALLFYACRSGEVKPVDIYPEDMCAVCRMAFSDHRFASEIIDDRDEVYKFDDIGCMLEFRTSSRDVAMVSTFVKDYDTDEWIPFDRATVVKTGIHTPMGSGKVAFRDSARAAEFARQHPPAVGQSARRSGGGA